MSNESQPPAAEKPADIVVLHSSTEDGKGVRVVRSRRGQLEVGEMRPLVSGQPIVTGEVVALKPREKTPWVCDVEQSVVIGAAGETRQNAGPAQVSSDAYRASWDRIFGAPAAHSTMN